MEPTSVVLHFCLVYYLTQLCICYFILIFNMIELLPFINISNEHAWAATSWGIHHRLWCRLTQHPALQDQQFSVFSWLSESLLMCCSTHQWQKATLLMLSCMCSLTVHRLYAWLVMFYAVICTKTCWSNGNKQPLLPWVCGLILHALTSYLHTNSSPWKCHWILSPAGTWRVWQSNHLFTFREARLDHTRGWRVLV